MLRLLISFILLFNITNAFAMEEFLPDPQEQRARELFLQVKCLVCEGQVIESSSTQIAFEMRKLIRQQIKNGLTNKEIKSGLIKDYGPEILTLPSINNQTTMLWFLPILFFLVGAIFIFCKFNRKAKPDLVS